MGETGAYTKKYILALAVNTPYYFQQFFPT